MKFKVLIVSLMLSTMAFAKPMTTENNNKCDTGHITSETFELIRTNR